MPAETCEVFFFLFDTERGVQTSERFVKHIVGSTSYPTKEEEETYACEKSSIIFTVSSGAPTIWGGAKGRG